MYLQPRNLTYRYQNSHHFQTDLFQTIILGFQPLLSAGVIVFVALDIQIPPDFWGFRYTFGVQITFQVALDVYGCFTNRLRVSIRKRCASKGDGLANFSMRWETGNILRGSGYLVTGYM